MINISLHLFFQFQIQFTLNYGQVSQKKRRW